MTFAGHFFNMIKTLFLGETDTHFFKKINSNIYLIKKLCIQVILKIEKL